MVVCAAIRITMKNIAGTQHVICGVRHADCLKTIAKLNDNWKLCGREDGFMTNFGEFLDRKEALRHASMCGQLSATTLEFKEEHEEDELYSEDLY